MDNKYPQNPNENQQPQNNEEKSNKVMKRLFQLVVILLLIIIIILLLLRSCGDGWHQQPTKPTGGGVIFDPNAGEDTRPDETKAQRPSITVPGWPKIVIPCDQLEVPVDFFNPQDNAGWYHLQFELRLPTDSGIGYEVLYTSGLVEAGKHIQKITLSRALPAGTYKAIIHIQPYRVEDNSKTHDAVQKTEITAINVP